MSRCGSAVTERTKTVFVGQGRNDACWEVFGEMFAKKDKVGEATAGGRSWGAKDGKVGLTEVM